MLKEICKDNKIVYYWMTEEENVANKAELNKEYKEWKVRGFNVCTFISGKENLTALTKDLLIYNKKLNIKNEYYNNKNINNNEAEV